MSEDQDFFFDEDEQAAPSKEAKPARQSTSNTSRTADVAAPAAAPGMLAQQVSMAVASLIGVIALLAGVIIGILIPIGTSSAPTAPTTIAPGAGGGSAPQLSPEQLQGGELPEGHPNIGGGAEGSGTATGTGK